VTFSPGCEPLSTGSRGSPPGFGRFRGVWWLALVETLSSVGPLGSRVSCGAMFSKSGATAKGVTEFFQPPATGETRCARFRFARVAGRDRDSAEPTGSAAASSLGGGSVPLGGVRPIGGLLRRHEHRRQTDGTLGSLGVLGVNRAPACGAVTLDHAHPGFSFFARTPVAQSPACARSTKMPETTRRLHT